MRCTSEFKAFGVPLTHYYFLKWRRHPFLQINYHVFVLFASCTGTSFCITSIQSCSQYVLCKSHPPWVQVDHGLPVVVPVFRMSEFTCRSIEFAQKFNQRSECNGFRRSNQRNSTRPCCCSRFLGNTGALAIRERMAGAFRRTRCDSRTGSSSSISLAFRET